MVEIANINRKGILEGYKKEEDGISINKLNSEDRNMGIEEFDGQIYDEEDEDEDSESDDEEDDD